MTTVTTAPTEQDQLVAQRLERLLAEHDPRQEGEAEFRGHVYDAGLAAVHFPEGYGGLGVSPKLQRVVDDRLRAAGMRDAFGRNPIGLGMAMATILTHGTEEQKQRHLRPCFTNEEIWCQLFSEPGAGSDVASLSTRALRDGDEWVVSGQKVWTTLAHVARWGLLIARTDPEAVKHKGMTYFIVDMQAPGVEVRPLRQITGEAEFNEVYFTDVRVPDSARLGDVGEGWGVSLTTLMNERVSIGGRPAPRNSGPIGQALKVWRDLPDWRKDAITRDRLMRLWVAAECARLTNVRAQQMRAMGNPGPEGSTAKLAFAEINQDIYLFCIEMLGAAGTLYGSYEMTRPDEAKLVDDDVHKMALRARANSIEGGTSEIMRNILGERVLGLPGEPRVDKDLPWSRVPRS